MKKTALISALMILIISISLCISSYAQDTNELFDKNKEEYILQNPFSSKDNADTIDPSKLLLVVGKDRVLTLTENSYPMVINNNTGDNAYYYMTGSNSMELLLQRPDISEYLKEDYVIEYDMTYDENSSGYISFVINFNYSYYIDVHVCADGTGDFSFIAGDETTSVMDNDSMLNAENSKEVLSALFGENQTIKGRKINVALRVKSGENNMPEDLALYINGALVAKSENSVLNDMISKYTPEYEVIEGATFPKNKLGNIIALKCADGVVANLENIRIYEVAKDSIEPSALSQKLYAETYGNNSYKDTLDTQVDTEADDTDTQPKEVNYDALLIVVVILSACSILFLLLIIIIIKKRTEKQ